MSTFFRGNLAVELETSRAFAKRKKKRTVVVKSSIPTGEKLLYLLLISIVVACVGFVGVRYIEISQYNYQIQELRKQIGDMEEKNASLQLKIEQMSNRDRIYAEAEKMGMVPASGSVRVIANTDGANDDAPAQPSASPVAKQK